MIGKKKKKIFAQFDWLNCKLFGIQTVHLKFCSASYFNSFYFIIDLKISVEFIISSSLMPEERESSVGKTCYGINQFRVLTCHTAFDVVQRKSWGKIDEIKLLDMSVQ